jgi:hypothetical protein
MIVRKHTIEDCNDSVERTFVYESIKRIITHNMFSSIFALFGKAASGGKQVKQGIRLNP